MRARTFGWVGALALAACSSGYFVDQAEVCRRDASAPGCPGPGGAAGASGSGGGGASGTAGTSGAGGSAMGSAGLGGGGSGGNGSCASDVACGLEQGSGSLCVGDACTSSTASCSKSTLVVVPDEAFAGTIESELATVCHYRQLGAAFTAASMAPSGTTRVLVYAASVEGPVNVPDGVRLEGRATAPATLVALTAGGGSGAGGGAGASGSSGAGGAGAAALVTLGDKTALAGFALDAEGATGVRIAAGKASLEGPLELKGGTPALSIEGTAAATVIGKAEAIVLFTGNARGVRVGPTAGLTMTGDTSETGLVLTGTNGGAAVLVEAGDSSAEVVLTGLHLTNNTGSDVLGGTGAVEVRSGRKVTLTNNVFENNRNGLRLNGLGANEANDFVNVLLVGNRFVVGVSTGVAICGADLLAATTLLRLGAGNELPSGAVDTQSACAALTQQGSCNGGAMPAQRDLGVLDIVKPFVVQCPSLPPRLSGASP
jgi:hypothetical protein